MVRLFQLIRRLAASELPVLVCGETGAGKENAAFAVHHGSPRAKGPFVVLNCAALQETLVESELFGHERGAFSGAAGLKLGLLETASGGTVFLDEIGELSLAAQAKLLRAVETKRITRVGGVRPTDVDIRIVAATHRDLEAEVAAGRFRKDLFFRLSAATIMLPPLRERPREITLLARTFLTEACARAGRPPMELSAATMLALARYAWPGNVRELKNTMDYAAAALEDEIVEPWHLPARISGDAVTPSEDSETARPAQAEDPADASVAVAGSGEPRGEARPFGRAFRPLAEEIKGLERRRMTEALEATSGFQKRAAELIGMPLRTFVLKLKQHGIARRERGGPQ
jgi:two-component system response regulator AtoC